MHAAITRRSLLWTFGCIAAVSAPAQTGGSNGGVHQEVDFKATPARIYDALLDAKQFAAFTKGKAEIERRPGGTFKLFDGRILGRTVELVPNQIIVQAWRSPAWTPGVYTVIRFELFAQGSGTHLVFDQAGYGIDQEEWKNLDKGWPLMYWEPLRKYLAI
jgi:activator of HSP90 ATPase